MSIFQAFLASNPLPHTTFLVCFLFTRPISTPSFLLYPSGPTLIFISEASVCCQSPPNAKLVYMHEPEARSQGWGWGVGGVVRGFGLRNNQQCWPPKTLFMAPPVSALQAQVRPQTQKIRLLPPLYSVFLPGPHRGMPYSLPPNTAPVHRPLILGES